MCYLMKQSLNFFILSIIFVSIFSGCRTTHKAEKPIVIKENRKLKEITADSLLMFINDSAFRAERLSGKAEVETDIEGNSNSFDIAIRARKDSAIWISISPLLGIEVMRVLITRDSVKYLDRIHKKYQVTDYQFLNELLRMNIDYEIIQGVLTGNLFSYKKNKFNSVYNDEDKYYILSTLGKRKLNRSLEEKDPNKPIIQDMWVNDSTFRITKLSIEDNKIDKTLLTGYEDFRPTDTGLFPYKSKTRITAEKTINISIYYSKITVNEEQEFPFHIPRSYEKIR